MLLHLHLKLFNTWIYNTLGDGNIIGQPWTNIIIILRFLFHGWAWIYGNHSLITFQNVEIIFSMPWKVQIVKDYAFVASANRNWPKCNHFIYNYMWLLISCDYIWTFLQLFLVLVIFVTMLHVVCNYFDVHLYIWTTFNLVFIQEE
jgi:hypothetical protein